jgi:hypothetical protein
MLDLKPALEHNFFKYDESARKTIGVRSYQPAGIRYNDYTEDQCIEHRISIEHSISFGGSVRQGDKNLNGVF